MMWFLLILLVLLFIFCAPLRKWYVRRLRFTLPATLGGVFGFCFGCWATGMGVHVPFLPILTAVGAAFAAGQSGKEWADKVFGKDQDAGQKRS